MQQENGKGIYNAGPALIKIGHITLTALHKETEIVSGNHSRTLTQLTSFYKNLIAARREDDIFYMWSKEVHCSLATKSQLLENSIYFHEGLTGYEGT